MRPSVPKHEFLALSSGPTSSNPLPSKAGICGPLHRLFGPHTIRIAGRALSILQWWAWKPPRDRCGRCDADRTNRIAACLIASTALSEGLQSLLDVFDEKDAEGFRAERHEYGTRPYIYRL